MRFGKMPVVQEEQTGEGGTGGGGGASKTVGDVVSKTNALTSDTPEAKETTSNIVEPANKEQRAGYLKTMIWVFMDNNSIVPSDRQQKDLDFKISILADIQNPSFEEIEGRRGLPIDESGALQLTFFTAMMQLGTIFADMHSSPCTAQSLRDKFNKAMAQ